MCDICKYVERVVNSKKVRKTVKKVMAVSGNHIKFEAVPSGVKVWLLTEDKEPLMFKHIHLDDLNVKEVKAAVIDTAIGYYEHREEIDQNRKRLDKYPLLPEQLNLVEEYRGMESALILLKHSAKVNNMSEDQELLRKLTFTLRNAKTIINEIEGKTILAESDTFPKDDLIDRIVRGLKFIFKIKD